MSIAIISVTKSHYFKSIQYTEAFEVLFRFLLHYLNSLHSTLYIQAANCRARSCDTSHI